MHPKLLKFQNSKVSKTQHSENVWSTHFENCRKPMLKFPSIVLKSTWEFSLINLSNSVHSKSRIRGSGASQNHKCQHF